MAVSKTPNMTNYEAERHNFHLEVPTGCATNFHN